MGLVLALASEVGGGRWGFVLQVVVAMLAVAPKGLGFVGVGVPKGPEELRGYMWDCSGRLGKMGIMCGMPKSNGVVAKVATGFVVAGLATG